MRTGHSTKCFMPLRGMGARLAPWGVFVDRSVAVVLLWFSVACFRCRSFVDVSLYVCLYYF